MGFRDDKWTCNDGFGDADFERGSHMFLKIADVGEYAICVQSNTSSKASPPLVAIIQSVYLRGRGGSHTSVSDLYVMHNDMAFSYGRQALPDEIQRIRAGLAANIECIRFYRIERTDDGYQYKQVVAQNVYNALISALLEALNNGTL
jgi:hypothetical protein